MVDTASLALYTRLRLPLTYDSHFAGLRQEMRHDIECFCVTSLDGLRDTSIVVCVRMKGSAPASAFGVRNHHYIAFRNELLVTPTKRRKMEPAHPDPLGDRRKLYGFSRSGFSVMSSMASGQYTDADREPPFGGVTPQKEFRLLENHLVTTTRSTSVTQQASLT